MLGVGLAISSPFCVMRGGCLRKEEEEGGFCLLKGIAEAPTKTKHAEASVQHPQASIRDAPGKA